MDIMTLQIKIPNIIFDNPDLDIIPTEEILAEGSLALFDMTHPFSPVPRAQTTGTIKNLATSAKHLVGSSTIDGSITVAGGGKGLLERTSKGGLHGNPASTVTTSGNLAYTLVLSADVRTYITNNRNHSFYISLWNNVTKIPESMNTKALFSAITNYDTNYLYTFKPGSIQPTDSKRIGSFSTGDGLSKGNLFNSIAVDGATAGWGTFSASQNGLWVVGANSQFHTGATGPYPAQILYRAYIEDLTVSKRSFEEVQGIDYALYQKEVLTEGGRYFGDTYTDPTLIG